MLKSVTTGANCPGGQRISVSKSLAEESRPQAANKVGIIFCRGVYLAENTPQAASVRVGRRRRPRSARGRLQAFFDSLSAGANCPGGILLEKGRAMGNTVAVEVANMLAAAWLMLSSLFYSLQLSSGSFPRPLTEEEERYYLDLAGKGDLEARNVLIERNLRLVAHIMKN